MYPRLKDKYRSINKIDPQQLKNLYNIYVQIKDK